MGALMGSVFVIASRSIKDIPTFVIALLSLLVLIYIKKIKEPAIILSAAIIGVILKLIL
jgi:chromate transporter